jgi:diguanylate cyclase (GGDEF)-like protein
MSRLASWGILAAFTAVSTAAVVLWRRANTEHRARLGYEQQLHNLAMSDPLTGLANRRVAVDRMTQALERAKRTHKVVAVLYVDVDKFKTINEGYGSAAGDTMLIAVADRLRASCRIEDTVARLGGDEFLVICEDLTDPEAAWDIAERTRVALAEPYTVGDLTLPGSASVGVTTAFAGEPAAVVLARADSQMYQAKAAKRWVGTQAGGARTPDPAVLARPAVPAGVDERFEGLAVSSLKRTEL